MPKPANINHFTRWSRARLSRTKTSCVPRIGKPNFGLSSEARTKTDTRRGRNQFEATTAGIWAGLIMIPEVMVAVEDLPGSSVGIDPGLSSRPLHPDIHLFESELGPHLF